MAVSLRLQQLEEAALLLPPEDRETLVERLLRSLREEMLPKIDEAWLAAAESRYREYKDGCVEGIPADEVFADVRRELGWSG